MAQPRKIARLARSRRHDHELIRRETRDREVRLDAGTLVEPLRVDELAGRDIDLRDRDPVQQRECVRTLHEELGEARLVEETDRVAHRLALDPAGLEPVLAAVGVLIFGL